MIHEKYITRCLELAKKGGKKTKSNPQVGALLVHNEKIIGEGYHEYFGGPHAEVNCIQSVKDVNLIPESTLYVSLEPCCTSGKTPPCTDLIIRSEIKKVVICTLDINPNVHGKSVKILRDNDIEVKIGILEEAGKNLIQKFKVNYLERRPYVLLKIVKSKDNFIGRRDEKIWLSNEITDIYTHKIRSKVDGIMAGSQTVINDNPSLTTRNYPGENPIRITIDRLGRIPSEYLFFQLDSKAIYFTERERKLPGNIQQILINYEEFSLKTILNILYGLGLYSLLIEGGKKLIDTFIVEKLWDEAMIVNTQIILANGITASNLHGRLVEEFSLGNDKIQRIYPV